MDAEQGSSFGQTRGFLFADLRGYTDFVERHGDDAGARLLERYRLLVRGVVARNAGAEVRTEGDSFYILFPSASQAVIAALDIVSSAATESTEHPEAPIRVGVGVHAGETSDLPDGPVGSAVNLAARICAQAQAGEVLVSDTVRGLTRTRQVASFGPAGSRRLKGIAEPIALYRALAPGQTVVGQRRVRAVGGQLPIGLAGAGLLGVLVIGFFVWLGMQPGASPQPSSPAVSDATATPPNTPARSTPPPSVASPSAGIPTAPPVTGTRIIYSRQIGREGCDASPDDAKLHVLDPDQPEIAPYRLTDRSNLFELNPSWSADGSKIGFVGSIARGPGGLFAIGPSAESLVTLAAPREAPAINVGGPTNVTVAPDGSALVHMSEDQIWRTPLDGTGMTQIAGVIPPEAPEQPPPEATEFYRDVAYRSDGSLLVLVVGVEGGTPWLETMADDGSNRVRADLDLDGLDAFEIALADDDDTLAIQVGSEEGSSIRLGRMTAGRPGFEVLDLGVSNPRQPDFSPEGNLLVFRGGDPGAEELYVVDLDSGEASQLTDDPETSACSPTWRSAPPDLVAARPEPEPGDVRAFELGQIPAGPVLNDVVEPPIQLTFPDGWFARRNYVDGWSVFRPGETYGEVDYGRLQFGQSEPCGDTDPVALGTRPDELLANLQARDDLDLAGAAPINLGGYSGITVEVSGKPGKGCGDPEFPFWALFVTAEDAFGLGPDEHLRLIALDVRGATRSFLVFAMGEDLDPYWATQARPLLETMAFPEV